jgi:hypothetical protein
MTWYGWEMKNGEWQRVTEGDSLDECSARLIDLTRDRPSGCRMMTAGQHPRDVQRQRWQGRRKSKQDGLRAV